MGRAQGEAFAQEIHSAAAFYEKLAARSGGVTKMMAGLGPFVDAARTHTPELADEVEGMAEGAALDPEILWFFNAMEEVWPFEACTTIVAAAPLGDRRDDRLPRSSSRWLLHAEQWYAGHDGIGVVIAEPSDAPAFVSPTPAGFLPVVGMNAAGVAQGVDSLEATDETAGVPRLLVSRSVLGAENIDHAVQLATNPQRAGGYAYMLASMKRTIALEVTTTTSAVLAEERAHTNHSLDPLIQQVATKKAEGSVGRLKRAQTLLAEKPPRSLDDCIELLSDHEARPQAICLHDETGHSEEGGTVFGMVCDLESGVVAVSRGLPCSTEWQEYEVPNFTRAAAHVV